jgi:phenylalanyl-tRNA synthetase alpha chain
MDGHELVEALHMIGRDFERDLEAAGLDMQRLEGVRLNYLGRKGRLTAVLKEIPKLASASLKGDVGKLANSYKTKIESDLNDRREFARGRAERAREALDTLDVTLPSRLPRLGHLHPTTIVRREMETIFSEMGYSIDPGPEVENDWYNFEALNFTPDHPARDTQDTFFLDVFHNGEPYLLRTHTSNVQIRSMEKQQPPVNVLSCGRVYRRDEITMRRSPMFHQAEGFLVDRGIHIGHLRATLEHFIKRLFGPESKMRMRPSYFPFTEPSAEVDMSCVFCKGAGCGTCSQTGWMEILGCGMIHPQVLRNVGIDPEEWSGFAFGLGLDRCAMIKFDIPNIRTLFENDLRVLQQFV